MFDLFQWIIDIIDRNKQIRHGDCNHIYSQTGDIDVPLTEGRHAAFVILQCDKCSERTGFPSDNLKIAIEEGTEETKERLKELGLVNV